MKGGEKGAEENAEEGGRWVGGEGTNRPRRKLTS